MIEKVPATLLYFSKKLRKEPTIWEKKLWVHLRNRNLGFRFKRQVRIGNYLVDFCCHEKKFIIELDGGRHNNPKTKDSDLEKTKFLSGEGYKVVRFWNSEIDNDLESALRKILKELD